jgi:ribonucleotide monophosphatase NagD (HAD superfamily)
VASMLETTQEPFVAQRVVMVGDRPETDGLFAARLGCRFALVRSGVSAADDVIDGDIHIDLDVADLAEVARHLIHTTPARQ